MRTIALAIALALIDSPAAAGTRTEEPARPAPEKQERSKFPDAFASRRERKLGEAGNRELATVKTEKAVVDGLVWLARHQAPDGSWAYGQLTKICSRSGPCTTDAKHVTDNYNSGLTGLALLAFLGAGHGVESKETFDGRLEGGRTAGDVVAKGVSWALNRLAAAGHFTAGDMPFMYNEAALTCALVEAFAMSPGSVPTEAASKAVVFLVEAQRPNPNGSGFWGWRYMDLATVRRQQGSLPLDPTFLSDSDTSATAWCVQALASARYAGIPVPDQSFSGAFDFIESTTGADGIAGYLNRSQAGQAVAGGGDHFEYHSASISAMNMIVRCHAKGDPKDSFLSSGAAFILKDLPKVGLPDSKTGDHLSVDYCYWYYGTYALRHLDGPGAPKRTGKRWGPWYTKVCAALLSLQVPSVAMPARDSKDRPACRHGGWLTPDRWGAQYGGPIYQTAMAVMTLQAPYRYRSALVKNN